MKKIIYFIIFLMLFLSVNSEQIHIISKKIDVSLLKGTFFEIATNASTKIVPGIGCRCTEYNFSELKKKEDLAYLYVKFTCQRNFFIKQLNSFIIFKMIISSPFTDQNSNLVDEFHSDVYAVTKKDQMLVFKNLFILYAQLGEDETYKYLILSGSKLFDPLIILSKERYISNEEYNKILNALFLAGFDPKLINWPFIINTDQTLCE